MVKLRAGIIGLGVGEAHIAGYRSHAGCDVVAICDLDTKKLAEVAAKNPGVRALPCADEILADPAIDVVSIASYDDHHSAHVLRAIDHGKHIFAEKPLCLLENDAREIRSRLTARPKLKFSSNLILRQCPRFRKVKALIDDGEMGEIYYLEGDYNYGRIHKIVEGWRGKLDYYSVILGGGVHIVDLLMWFSGKRVIEVFVYGNALASRSTGFRFNDMTIAALKFDDGALGKIAVNFACVQPHFHEVAVYGTKKTFRNTPSRGILYVSRDPKDAVMEMNEPYPGTAKGDLIHDFVEAILRDREPSVSKNEVFDSMSVCFAMERSMNEGRPVKVEYI